MSDSLERRELGGQESILYEWGNTCQGPCHSAAKQTPFQSSSLSPGSSCFFQAPCCVPTTIPPFGGSWVIHGCGHTPAGSCDGCFGVLQRADLGSRVFIPSWILPPGHGASKRVTVLVTVQGDRETDRFIHPPKVKGQQEYQGPIF